MTTVQESIDIEVTLSPGAVVPTYGTTGAAGADVRANLAQDLIIPPGHSALVPTGIRMAIPVGYEIQVRPRSGLALKDQVTVLNTPGTIDSDYRGEVGIILINHGTKDFVVSPGMRIGQLILAQVYHARFIVGSDLTSTTRGSGGFGHTGVH